MWECNICKKVEVPNKGKGFRAFIEYEFFTLMCDGDKHKHHYPFFGTAKVQMRICAKCLKSNYKDIKI